MANCMWQHISGKALCLPNLQVQNQNVSIASCVVIWASNKPLNDLMSFFYCTVSAVYNHHIIFVLFESRVITRGDSRIRPLPVLR